MAVSASAVDVLSLEDEYTSADRSSWNPVPTQAFPVVGPARLGYSPRLSAALLNSQAEVVMSHGLWMHPSAAVWKWHNRTGRPYIAHPHGMLDPWAVKNARWKKRIVGVLYEDRHLRDAACIRALCESEAESIRAFGLKNPIAIIPNGIDLPQLDAESREQKAKSRNPVSLLKQSGRKVLLYLGRIHPKKGLVNLIKAWAAVQRSEVRGQRSDWVLAVAGWDQGGHEAELKRLATELGIAWTDAKGARGNRKAESRKRKCWSHQHRAGSGKQRARFSSQLSALSFFPPLPRSSVQRGKGRVLPEL